MSAVTIKIGVTFARLVHEHVDYPGDRTYTSWTHDRQLLASWRLMHSDWTDHRLVYIERCRLKPAADRSAAP